MRSKWAVALASAIAMTASAQEKKIIKIGTVFPLTGPCAVAGLRGQSAVEAMAEVINNKHPEINIPLAKDKGFLDGYKIVLVNADFQGKPDVAKSETERLFNQEGCWAVIGCYNSSASKPASAVAERMKKIFMCGASSSAALTERGLNYFFRCAATDRTESQEFVQFFQSVILKDKPGAIKTVGLIYENSEFGKHAAEEAKAACAKAGIAVVADVPFAPGATNLNSEIQTLKAKSPDAVFGACLGGDYALYVRTMKQMGWVPKLAINYCTGYQDPIIAKQLGSDGNFFMGGCGYSPEIGKKYMKDVAPVEAIYRQKTGVEFDSDSIQEAVALHVLCMAIDKARSLDPDKVAAVLHGTEFNSPLSLGGKVAFGPDGQNMKALSVITQLKDLVYVPVFPANYKDASAVFPIPDWSKR